MSENSCYGFGIGMVLLPGCVLWTYWRSSLRSISLALTNVVRDTINWDGVMLRSDERVSNASSDGGCDSINDTPWARE